MKIFTTPPLTLFLLDQKKSAKKIKASFLFSIRYGHVGECHDGSHFLHLFGLPMFGSQPILRNATAVQSAFAHRFPICSMG
jgi:hypothetical protein